MIRAKKAFGVSPIKAPPPPLRTKSALGPRARAWPGAAREGGPVDVFVRDHVRDSLGVSWGFSREVEEGGFLFGEVHRDADAPSRWLVVVTEVIRAEHTEEAPDALVFSPESFASMRRHAEAKRDGASILGWFHTHLVAGPEDRGLSVVDRDLHFSTFRRPWQVAALVCVDPARDPEGREVSFFARQGDFLVPCAVEVLA
ncbi:hypothetical protein [Polyangium fumosum]|uniref:JAB domain-containing protein n=1 Tax=Polyangium fumosum TaxID=889272 RepID=A0A4V5PMF4_9BACT|nr:hypothetical protein [Polyangium fumosum]TKD03186.1 hypothetical protein E8A74_27125 [Polyangium fumosum]